VTVREVLFEDGGATVVDAAVNPTARLEVNGVRLSARDFAWPARTPVPVQLDAPTPGAGRITARGTLDLVAKSLQMQLTGWTWVRPSPICRCADGSPGRPAATSR
jgi:hypothetical protein